MHHWLIPHLIFQFVVIAIILYCWLRVALKGNGHLVWWVKLAALSTFLDYLNQLSHRYVMTAALSGRISHQSIDVSAALRDITLAFMAYSWIVFWREWRKSHPK